MTSFSRKLAAEKNVIALAAAMLLLVGVATISAMHAREAQTPAAPRRIAPEALAPAEQEVNFELVETSLVRAKVDDRGNVVLSAQTEAALLGAVAALPPTMASAALQRVQFLIRKSLPGAAGEQLAVLFDEYYRYKQAERSEIGAIGRTNDLDAEIRLFNRTVALRRSHFGNGRANRLFGQQQALAMYTFELRRLEADARLSESARAAKQRALEAEYAKRIRHP